MTPFVLINPFPTLIMTTVSTEPQSPRLNTLDFYPYIDAAGYLPEQFSKVVGIYAIFDGEKCLQFVGYSRDIAMSLKQHLVRCPDACQWIKVKTIDRPKRTILEAIQNAWIEENGDRPLGNGVEAERWTQPIDAKLQMTADEKSLYAAATNELEQAKVLKNIARRVEANIKASLESRGVKEPLRFDPKLKDQGLLNIKPVK